MAMRTGSQDAAYSDHNVTAIRIIRHTKNNHLLSFRSDESDEGYGFGWSVSGAWRKYIINNSLQVSPAHFWQPEEHIPKQS